jgi:capsular exopolysaccharide synthesis family protein
LVPGQPNGTGLTYLLLAGLGLGAVAGVVAAFLLERLDTTAREDDDIALALGEPVLGSVPTLGLSTRGSSGLVMLSSGGSVRTHAAREAFRRLRTSVQFLNTSSEVSSILITSSTPGEGKSLTAANLSIALAQNGASVVLVNADMRRPVLEKLLGVEPDRPGLSEYLSSTSDLAPVPVPNIRNLWLIPSGQKVGNPGELLNSDRFERLLKELEREGVQFVVIDTPPVLSTADAVSAARVVDGAIVVVDTERTDTTDLLRVRADLARTGAKILGAVMNRTKFKRGGFFRRRDHYTY